ncbi:MAG: outer membrane protein assembly factor BamD [Geminicoccaceae bacterium]
MRNRSTPLAAHAFPSWRRLGGALGLLVLLAGCGGNKGADAVPDQPPEDLYRQAQALLDREDYEKAGKAFEEVERQHPYSQWATRGELMAAYSYYQANKYDDAVAAAERYIDLHPGNHDVPYAYYMVGQSYYEQISDVGRDQDMTQKALSSFTELIRRYPDSSYASDAKLKIDLVRDHLAGKEMEVGRFYQKRQLWLAGINRFQKVVTEYQTTTHVPEALHRLTESYLALGMLEQAQESAAVLGYNFPGSEWYQRSYALLQGKHLEPQASQSGSWLSRLF